MNALGGLPDRSGGGTVSSEGRRSQSGMALTPGTSPRTPPEPGVSTPTPRPPPPLHRSSPAGEGEENLKVFLSIQGGEKRAGGCRPPFPPGGKGAGEGG